MEEQFTSSDAVSAVVERAGLSLNQQHQDHLANFGRVLGMRASRDPTNEENVSTDIEHLQAGILDPESFIQGYLPHEHPVQYTVHRPDGSLKQRVHSANLRTDTGGMLQGLQMFGDAPASWSSGTPSGTTPLNYGSNGASTATTTSITQATTINFGSTNGSISPATGAQNWPGAASLVAAASTFPTVASGADRTSSPSTYLTGGLAGRVVVAYPVNATTPNVTLGTIAWGVITQNTATTLSVDYWRTPSGGSAAEAAATIGANAVATNFSVLPIVSPFMYMALSNDSTAVTATDNYAQGFNAYTIDSGTTTIGESNIKGLLRAQVQQAPAGADGTHYSPGWFTQLSTGGPGSVTYGANTYYVLPGGNSGASAPIAFTVTANGTIANVVKFTAGGGSGTAGNPAFTVWKSALFNTAQPNNSTTSAGTIASANIGYPIFVAKLATAATLAFGDTLTVTWQITY